MVHKNVILTQIPYKGLFQYKDVFKIYPFLPVPDSYIRHFPTILEFSINPLIDKHIEIDDINLSSFINSNNGDVITEGQRITTFRNELLRMLSLLTNYYHFSYSINQSWFVPINTNSVGIPSPVWGQQWAPLIENDYNTVEFDKIELKKAQEYYGENFLHRVTNFILYPDDMDQLLDRYFALNDIDKDAFDKSIRLFYQGLILRNEMKSMSIVAFISSIETLANFDNINEPRDKCSECGNMKFSVAKKFKVFVEGSISAVSISQRKKYIKKIYDLRSRIVHTGLLHLSDMDRGFWNSTYQAEPFIVEDIEQIARISLINWLKKK